MRSSMVFVHVMPFTLVLSSHDASDIKYGTIVFLRSKNQNEVQHDFLVIWCHWYWHQFHIMPTTSSMAPLHSVVYDNYNELQHDFLDMWHHWHHHMMPLTLVSASYDTGSIIHGTIAFLKSRWSKWGVQHDFLAMCWHWHWNEMMLVVSSMASFHSLGQDNQNVVQHHFLVSLIPLVHVSVWHEADCFVNTTITFLRSRQLKWAATWFYGHVTPLVPALASCGEDGIFNDTTAFLRSRWTKWGTTWLMVMWYHWHQCHVMPVASSITPLHFLSQDDQNEV